MATISKIFPERPTVFRSSFENDNEETFVKATRKSEIDRPDQQ